MNEGVQAAIFETHHGGEFDATNVIESPVATVVTSLGMDHVAQLGPSIENIAWHKSGIFKPGSLAFSPPQDSGAMEMLQKRAIEKAADLKIVEHDPTLPADIIQLKPDVQRTNCSVALAAARAWTARIDSGNEITADDIAKGLEQFFWPGRFQIVSQRDVYDPEQTSLRAGLTAKPDLGPYQWFLDSAHNEMSVTKAGQWFLQTSVLGSTSHPGPRVLLFTQLSDQRESKEVLRLLAEQLRHHDVRHVIFTTYEIGGGIQTIVKEPNQDLSIVESFEAIWKKITPSSEVMFKPTITEAVEAAKEIGARHSGMQVLVTGSQHLVGGALLLLEPQLFGLNTPSQLQT